MPSSPFHRSKKNDAVVADETASWMDTPLEAVAVEADRYQSATSKEKWRRWAIIGALCCTPLLALEGIAVYSNSTDQSTRIDQLTSQVSKLENKAPVGITQKDDSPGRFAAYQTIQSWLANQPSPLPGGKILYWTGSQSVPLKIKGETRTIETFALTGGDGKGYHSSVEVAVDPRGGAQAISSPSLEVIPANAGDDWVDKDVWPGLTDNDDVPTSVPGAVQSWANAYVSGNAQQLGLAVGDPNSSHTYQPISGASGATVNVTDSATVPGGTIARIEMTINWNNGGGNPNGNPIDMDVLIKNASTAAPQVVAWGAAGSGPSLKAYQNATTLPIAQNSNNGSSSTSSSPTSTGPAPAKTSNPTESANK